MQKKDKTSLESIGYIKEIPKNADINDYEKINVKDKNGITKILYKRIEELQEFDKITDFNNSWRIFNDHLN